MSEKKVRFCQLLRDAVDDEVKAQKFYDTLIEAAKEIHLGELWSNVALPTIKSEERRHLELLSILYERTCAEESIKLPEKG